MVYHGPLRIRVSTATMGSKLNRSLLHYGKYIFLLLFNKHKFDMVRPFDQQIQLILHSFIITSGSLIYYSFNLVALFWYNFLFKRTLSNSICFCFSSAILLIFLEVQWSPVFSAPICPSNNSCDHLKRTNDLAKLFEFEATELLNLSVSTI